MSIWFRHIWKSRWTNYDHNRSQTAQSPESQISPLPSNKLNFILNPTAPDRDSSSPAATPLDPALITPSSPNTDFNAVSDHEVAFLLRHFGETAGQWMDLFDLGCYFGHLVPVQALTNPLLKYSACAYAAKQLGRVRGRKAIIGGLVCQQAEMEYVSQNPS